MELIKYCNIRNIFPCKFEILMFPIGNISDISSFAKFQVQLCGVSLQLEITFIREQLKIEYHLAD